MFGYEGGFLVRCAIVAIVVAAAALLPRGSSWPERCVLGVACLSALVAIRSFALGDGANAPIALLAAGIGFGVLVFSRSLRR